MEVETEVEEEVTNLLRGDVMVVVDVNLGEDGLVPQNVASAPNMAMLRHRDIAPGPCIARPAS
eukprot:3932719-Rhodomonas_salina.3